MFQNITENVQEEKQTKRRIDIKKFWNLNDIVLYILSFMVSTVSFNSEFMPFGLAIFRSSM